MTVVWPWEQEAVPRLVLGCASAGGRIGRRAALRAMARAYEHGVSAFDTARSYGYGEGESILGEFLRQRRDRAFVITKGGIPPAVGAGGVRRWVKNVARIGLRFAPALSSVVRSKAAVVRDLTNYQPQRLLASLEHSLSSLGVGRIDAYLIHDVPGRLPMRDDIISMLERQRELGHIGVWGVSGAADACASFADVPECAVMQFPASPLAIAQYPPGFPPRLGVRLGNQVLTDVEGTVAAEQALRRPLVDGICDALVVSMYSSDHLQSNLNAVRSPGV